MSASRSCIRAAGGLALLFLVAGLCPQGLVRAADQAGAGEEQFPNPGKPVIEDNAPAPVNTSTAGQEPRAVLVADPPAPQNKEKEAKAGDGETASAGSGYHLSLEEAIELAIQKNLNLLESRLNDRASDIGVREAWAQYFPTFNSGLNHSNSFSTGSHTGDGLTTISGGLTQQSPWGTQLGFSLSDTVSQTTGLDAGSASASLRQPLWKGAGTDVGLRDIRTARISRLISRGTLEMATQSLIFNVRTAYANIIRAIQSREVDRHAVQSAQKFLKLTEARFKADMITKLDLFNAEVQLRSRELDVVADERTLELTLDKLKQLLDVDLEENLQVDAPIVDFGEGAEPELDNVIMSDDATGTIYLQKMTKGDMTKGIKPVPVGERGAVLTQATHFDESVILNEALNNRLDLLNSRRSLAIQKLQALFSKDGLGHQIDLVGSFGRTTSGRSILEADNGKESNSWSAGISATFPWGKIKDRAAYERALLALEKAEIDLRLARTQVQADVRDIMRALRQNEKGMLIGGQLVEQAKRTAIATQVSFDRGLKDSFNVIQAEDALLAAKRDFINRKLDYVVQLAQLELTVGKPTGRVDLAGQSVGGMVDSKLPEELRSRGLPKPASQAEPRPADDPFSKTREYRQDYKADKDKLIIDK
jgi:outer membrane protein TolC